MKISALTVCVDYGPLLSQSLSRWMAADDLLVVTSVGDTVTAQLCESLGVRFHRTEAFFLDGAKFNKGRAIAEAYEVLDPQDWALFFDADIEPPVDWKDRTVAASKEVGNLYGVRRRQPDGSLVCDADLAGFFHLAHVSDPNMQIRPIVDTHWYHAGVYDSTFQDRWPKERRQLLTFEVVHHGEPGKNWCGVNNDEAVAALHRERHRHHGDWRHETIG